MPTHTPRPTRRHVMQGAAALGALCVLPYAARAAGHSGDTFETPGGDVTVFPVSHASFVMQTPAGVIYNDPVGAAEDYADFPPPDLILVTHEHGDHYAPDVLEALMGPETVLVTNPAVQGMMPESLASRATVLANGESADWNGVAIDAIPAYNLTEDRLQYHPEGRDNGYVVKLEGFTVYIAGDTEDIPEMRALSGIDLAFVPMNLPYTMDTAQAADAVAEFAPAHVYPYHYRGQEPADFAERLGDTAVEVHMGPWYG